MCFKEVKCCMDLNYSPVWTHWPRYWCSPWSQHITAAVWVTGSLVWGWNVFRAALCWPLKSISQNSPNWSLKRSQTAGADDTGSASLPSELCFHRGLSLVHGCIHYTSITSFIPINMSMSIYLLTIQVDMPQAALQPSPWLISSPSLMLSNAPSLLTD